MTKLYYTPPTDKQFNEIKEKVIELLCEVDSDNDAYGYATSKIDRIKDIQNVSDNFMYIPAMFDIHNQERLVEKLSEETRKVIKERMIDGGNPPEYIRF